MKDIGIVAASPERRLRPESVARRIAHLALIDALFLAAARRRPDSVREEAIRVDEIISQRGGRQLMRSFTPAVVDMAGTTIQVNGAIEHAAGATAVSVSGGELSPGFDGVLSSQRGAAKTQMFRALVGGELAGQALECFERELAQPIAAGLIRPFPARTMRSPN